MNATRTSREKVAGRSFAVEEDGCLSRRSLPNAATVTSSGVVKLFATSVAGTKLDTSAPEAPFFIPRHQCNIAPGIIFDIRVVSMYITYFGYDRHIHVCYCLTLCYLLH